jgi:hypothetical protein
MALRLLGDGRCLLAKAAQWQKEELENREQEQNGPAATSLWRGQGWRMEAGAEHRTSNTQRRTSNIEH